MCPKNIIIKPFTLNFIFYICIWQPISMSPVHLRLYPVLGETNKTHTLIIGYLPLRDYQNISS
nr:MAG TPA: hypothetical protein [Caudoviricetes sp.]